MGCPAVVLQIKIYLNSGGILLKPVSPFCLFDIKVHVFSETTFTDSEYKRSANSMILSDLDLHYLSPPQDGVNAL